MKQYKYELKQLNPHYAAATEDARVMLTWLHDRAVMPAKIAEAMGVSTVLVTQIRKGYKSIRPYAYQGLLRLYKEELEKYRDLRKLEEEAGILSEEPEA